MHEYVDRRRFLQVMGGAGLSLGVGLPGGRALGPLAPAPLSGSQLPRGGAPDPFEPDPRLPDPEFFRRVRREFLFPEEIAYCNTGTLGACPREVVETLVASLTEIESDLPEWPYFEADGEPLTGYQPLRPQRERAGRMIQAPADEVALTQNATMGLSFLAGGLELEPGDEVLSTDQEHSGGIGGWRLRAQRDGIVLRELPLDEATAHGPEGIVRLFADAITPRTRVLAFSHITSGLGTLLPARELCELARDHGIVSVVDGAQAVGQIQVDVKEMGCDAYVTSPHKWLLAPKGTGILYIREELQPRVWNTLASGGFEDRESGAFRFMRYGTGSLAVIHGFEAALEFMERIGIDRVERWDRNLTLRLREGLDSIPGAWIASPQDPRLGAAITTFGVRGVDGVDLQNALWERGIRVRAQAGERVRLSAHLYVGPHDIDRTLEVVEELAA